MATPNGRHHQTNPPQPTPTPDHPRPAPAPPNHYMTSQNDFARRPEALPELDNGAVACAALADSVECSLDVCDWEGLHFGSDVVPGSELDHLPGMRGRTHDATDDCLRRRQQAQRRERDGPLREADDTQPTLWTPMPNDSAPRTSSPPASQQPCRRLPTRSTSSCPPCRRTCPGTTTSVLHRTVLLRLCSRWRSPVPDRAHRCPARRPRRHRTATRPSACRRPPAPRSSGPAGPPGHRGAPGRRATPGR